MKIIKRSLIIASAIVMLALMVFCYLGLHLSDENISGFTGLWGIYKLNQDNVFIELTENPLQLLIRQGDEKGVFEAAYFDSWEDFGHPAIGTGTKNGQKYEYSLRSFTGKYYIVTLKT